MLHEEFCKHPIEFMQSFNKTSIRFGKINGHRTRNRSIEKHNAIQQYRCTQKSLIQSEALITQIIRLIKSEYSARQHSEKLGGRLSIYDTEYVLRIFSKF